MKTKNPKDATLRNVQAANKRFKELERRIKRLEKIIAAMTRAAK